MERRDNKLCYVIRLQISLLVILYGVLLRMCSMCIDLLFSTLYKQEQISLFPQIDCAILAFFGAI